MTFVVGEACLNKTAKNPSSDDSPGREQREVVLQASHEAGRWEAVLAAAGEGVLAVARPLAPPGRGLDSSGKRRVTTWRGKRHQKTHPHMAGGCRGGQCGSGLVPAAWSRGWHQAPGPRGWGGGLYFADSQVSMRTANSSSRVFLRSETSAGGSSSS